MPGQPCSVATCNSNALKTRQEGQNIRFFHFPKDFLTSREWIKRCRPTTDFDPKFKRICSLHFKESDFDDELKARLLNYPPKKLKKNAIPTLHMPSPGFQPETSSNSATSEKKKRHSKNARENRIGECLQQPKGLSKCNKKKSKEYSEAFIEGNKEISDKNMKKEIISPTNRKVGENCLKEVRQTEICSKNLEKEESLPFQYENEASKILFTKEEVAIEEGIEIGDKNTEEPISAPILNENNIGNQNTNTVLITLPIVKSIMKKSNESCTCDVYLKCFYCQLQQLKEENKALKNEIKKNLNDLKHANNLAKRHLRKQESQFESKVKIAFQQFLSPNQVIAVLRKKVKVKWSDEDFSKAFNILQFSKRFYIYLKENLNYPLPGLSSVRKWTHQASLKLEKECTPEILSDLPTSLENLPSDYPITSENLLSTVYPMQSENHSPSHKMDYKTVSNTHSENLSDHEIVSQNSTPCKENFNEISSSAYVQIEAGVSSDCNADSEKLLNKKTSAVASKPFQFHLSHNNYFKKLILKRHRRKLAIELKVKRFSCSVCQKGFDSIGALKRHFKTHVFDNPWTCDVCDDIFTSKFYLERHIFTHKNADQFVCDICDQTFIKKVTFQNHYLNHKNIQTQDVNTNQCIIKGTTNEKPGSDQLLVKNTFTQTQIKPYMCHFCDDLFENKSDLKLHLVVCKTENPPPKKQRMKIESRYFCELCNKGFRFRPILERHLLKHKNGKIVKRSKPKSKAAMPKTQKIVQCEICKRKFNSPSSYYRHKVLHDDNRNKAQVFCGVCDKGFSHNRYLNKHLKTHSEVKPYACVLCPKRFAQNSTLKKHYEKNHQNDTYRSITDFYV